MSGELFKGQSHLTLPTYLAEDSFVTKDHLTLVISIQYLAFELFTKRQRVLGHHRFIGQTASNAKRPTKLGQSPQFSTLRPCSHLE